MNDTFYGESILEENCIINRKTYGGRGRPRKIDYISLEEAHGIINRHHNARLSRIFVKQARLPRGAFPKTLAEALSVFKTRP